MPGSALMASCSVSQVPEENVPDVASQGPSVSSLSQRHNNIWSGPHPSQPVVVAVHTPRRTLTTGQIPLLIN